MKMNHCKSNTHTLDLTSLSGIISRMLGSTKDYAVFPSRGADKQIGGTSHTVPPIGQTEPRVVAPNPITGKSTPNGMTVSAAILTRTDSGNTTTHNSKRVRVLSKTPKSVDPTTGSHQSESMPHWYPPHFYLPWYPSAYQYLYTTPLTHYGPPETPGLTLQPLSRWPPSSCPLVVIVQQENPKNIELDRSARPIVERTNRNLLPDFDEVDPKDVEDDDVQARGGIGGEDGGGDGDDSDDGDEDWSEESSEESEEESYTTEADTSDTDSSAPDKGPACTR